MCVCFKGNWISSICMLLVYSTFAGNFSFIIPICWASMVIENVKNSLVHEDTKTTWHNEEWRRVEENKMEDQRIKRAIWDVKLSKTYFHYQGQVSSIMEICLRLQTNTGNLILNLKRFLLDIAKQKWYYITTTIFIISPWCKCC